MRENHFPHLLLGRKLRHDRQQRIREAVEDQQSFSELFKLLFHSERVVAQRAMRAIMLVVKTRPEFLQRHREQLFAWLRTDRKDVMGMAVQLIPKLKLTPDQLTHAWHLLSYLALNQNEQKTIRVHALQSLYELTEAQPWLSPEFQTVLNALIHNQPPAIQAKVLKFRRLLNPGVKVTV